MSPAALQHDTLAALAVDGPMQRNVPGFQGREGQRELAAEIAACIASGDSLVAEAGTGTGKTYAYLVPALLSGRRVIISTGTRALQDQLYHRDLPRVHSALGVGARTALLKGRANYLCLYRMHRAEGDPRGAGHAAALHDVVAWSGRTRSGDLAELPVLAEDSPLRPQVTSTVDNCIGGECPFWDSCFVVRARQAAQAADLVVVNHHLLLSDIAIRQEGFGEILPGAGAFILDEAHQLPELAAQFFGARLSARQLGELSRDAIAECAGIDGALALVQTPAQRLSQAIAELRLAMDPLPQRGAVARALAAADVALAIEALEHALDVLASAQAGLAEASPGMSACLHRTRALRRRLLEWLGDEVPAPTGEEAAEPSADNEAAGEGRGAEVRWYERSPQGFVLERTPLDVSGPLRRFREETAAAWVLTSATLAVGGAFGHIAARLGLDAPRTLLQASPFDWARQALCYLPPGLPDPNADGFGEAMLDAVRPVLEASGGRAFVLFTSHRALREAARRLADGPWPLFVQGSAPRHALLEAFRASGNGVLLGAASFWEGVDVAGESLSVVVIDRLPFAAPDDPVREARLEAVRRRGGNPFRDEQLPAAVIAFKQGVGRLIRSAEDRGVLVLCDPRLLAKSYGRVFLASLPPMPRCSGLSSVQDFFAGRRADPLEGAAR